MEEVSYAYRSYLSGSGAEVLTSLHTRKAGLSDEEAAQTLVHVGKNTVQHKKTRWPRTLARQFISPFVYLLGFAALVALVLGERLDAETILVILLVNGLLGFVQEFRAEQSLAALEQLIVPSVAVRRGGTVKQVSVHDLVPGDVVPIAAGDIAPADVRVIEAQGLLVDESILTGESVQVAKSPDPLRRDTAELSAAQNITFSGTKIIAGSGLGVIVTTGGNTVLGGIAHRIHHIERKSGYEAHLQHFSGFMMRLVVGTVALLFVAEWFLKGRGVNVPELFLFVLALAVSVVPEALPVVTTLTLSSGAARLAKKHAVVRRLSALEDLGNISILCTDKTGTITENKLLLKSIHAQSKEVFMRCALAEAHLKMKQEKISLAALSSFDQALYAYRASSLHASARMVWELPFDPKTRLSAIIVEETIGRRRRRVLVVRGAPEEVLGRSTAGAATREAIGHALQEEGKKGRRAFAVATRTLAPKEAVTLAHIKYLSFLGFASFEDPLKPTTKEALREAKMLGVDVRIITGDGPEVAFAVGYEIGLIEKREQVKTGAELRALPSDQLDAVIAGTRIFARVSPEEKFLILQSLQKNNSVGFLGEGVNDAPALELANVALVVQSAAPVAREAADVILLEKDLRVIIRAIADGRRTFENIGKYLKYTLIGNFGNFYTIAAISLILPFVPLLPVQILLTNLLTDFPLIAVAFDRVAQEDIKTPRAFALRPLILFSIFLGLTSSLFDFLFFGIFHAHPAPELRTLWFIFSIFTELALIFSIRTRQLFYKGTRPGLSLTLLAFLAAGVTVGLPFTALGQHAFHLIRPSVFHLEAIALLVIGYFAATETVKRLMYRFVVNGRIVPRKNVGLTHS